MSLTTPDPNAPSPSPSPSLPLSPPAPARDGDGTCPTTSLSAFMRSATSSISSLHRASPTRAMSCSTHTDGTSGAYPAFRSASSMSPYSYVVDVVVVVVVVVIVVVVAPSHGTRRTEHPLGGFAPTFLNTRVASSCTSRSHTSNTAVPRGHGMRNPRVSYPALTTTT